MRLLFFRAVDGVRLGVQNEYGVIDVHRATGGTGPKAPDPRTEYLLSSAPALVNPT